MRKLVIIGLLAGCFSCDRDGPEVEEELIHYQKNISVPEELDDGLVTDSPEHVDFDMTELKLLFRRLEEEGAANRVHSILIARNNKLVVEAYFNGWSADRQQDMRSATKSITSALVGIALDHDVLPSEDAFVLDFFPEYDSIRNWDERKSEIRIVDLLRMRTGLNCDDWNSNSLGHEEKMYRTFDWIKFILDLPVIVSPGSNFSYCTGAPVVLGGVIANASGKTIPEFADETLFSPLGITDYRWEFMPNRRADTGGHLHFLPRDMLKIGMLFQNDGVWKGQQLISEEWVKRSTKPQGAAGGYLLYSYLWWNISWSIKGQSIDAYAAIGNGGQLIFVLPDLDATVVFTGNQYNENWLPSRLSIMENTILPSFN